MDQGICSNGFLDTRLLRPCLRVLGRHYLTTDDIDSMVAGEVVAAPTTTRVFFWQMVSRYGLPVWDGLNAAVMGIGWVYDPRTASIGPVVLYDAPIARKLMMDRLDGPFRSIDSFGKQVDRTYADVSGANLGPLTPIFFEPNITD